MGNIRGFAQLCEHPPTLSVALLVDNFFDTVMGSVFPSKDLLHCNTEVQRALPTKQPFTAPALSGIKPASLRGGAAVLPVSRQDATM